MQWKINLGLKHLYGFHHFKNLHQAPQRHNACATQQFKNEALPQQGMHSHFFPLQMLHMNGKTAALEQILAGSTSNRTTSSIQSHISEHIHRSWTKPRHKHTIWISAQAADTYLAEVKQPPEGSLCEEPADESKCQSHRTAATECSTQQVHVLLQ